MELTIQILVYSCRWPQMSRRFSKSQWQHGDQPLEFSTHLQPACPLKSDALPAGRQAVRPPGLVIVWSYSGLRFEIDGRRGPPEFLAEHMLRTRLPSAPLAHHAMQKKIAGFGSVTVHPRRGTRPLKVRQRGN